VGTAVGEGREGTEERSKEGGGVGTAVGEGREGTEERSNKERDKEAGREVRAIDKSIGNKNKLCYGVGT